MEICKTNNNPRMQRKYKIVMMVTATLTMMMEAQASKTRGLAHK